MTTTQAPPPGWSVAPEAHYYVAYNPRGGSLVAVTEADALVLAWLVEYECRKAEGDMYDYRGWVVTQAGGVWRGVRQTQYGPYSVQEGSQRALEARIDAIAGPVITVSPQDAATMAEAYDNPKEPNDLIREAARLYQERVKNGR